jgi:hypothetical protein
MRRPIRVLLTATSLLAATLAHATPSHLWSHRFQGTDEADVYRLVVDPSGNLVMTGPFLGRIWFPDAEYISLGLRDIFVVKFDRNGNTIWSWRVGQSNSDRALDVDTDLVGNVIAGGHVAPTGTDINAMVVKYDPDGTQKFLKIFGVGDNKVQIVDAIAVDLQKNTIVAGEFDTSIDLGGGPLLATGGRTIFLAKLGQLGEHIWSKRFTTATTSAFFLTSLEVRADGHSVLYGMVDGSIDFGSGIVLTSAGLRDVFLAEFDANGNIVWADNYGDATEQVAGMLGLNESGQIAITGYHYGVVNFGGAALTATGPPDAFVAVLAPDGAHAWSNTFGATGIQWGLDVTWADNQDVVLMVRGVGTVDFGGGPVAASGGGSNVFLARFFGATGNHRSSTRFFSAAGMDAQIAEDNGRLFLAGNVIGDVDFGGGLLSGSNVYGEVYIAGFTDILTGVAAPPLDATLQQNVPNPFNPTTTIGYTLHASARAVIEIFDASGRVVARLDQGTRPGGTYTATWDGHDRSGRAAASGVYFSRLPGMPAAQARKMVLLK